jgi:hypothetical protein
LILFRALPGELWFWAHSMKTLLATLLSFTVFSASATVYNSDGTVQNIQAIYNMRAVDRDTIMVPAGRFSWTARRLESE